MTEAALIADGAEVKMCPTGVLTAEKSGTIADTNTDGIVGNAGDIITYTYVIENTGTVTVFDIIMTEDALSFTGNGTLPAPVYSSGGSDLDGDTDDMDLNPTDTVTWTAIYTLVQDDIDQGSVANQATASGTDTTGTAIMDDTDDPSTVASDDPTIVTTASTPPTPPVIIPTG